jgi:hypothetical protein
MAFAHDQVLAMRIVVVDVMTRQPCLDMGAEFFDEYLVAQALRFALVGSPAFSKALVTA